MLSCKIDLTDNKHEAEYNPAIMPNTYKVGEKDSESWWIVECSFDLKKPTDQTFSDDTKINNKTWGFWRSVAMPV